MEKQEKVFAKGVMAFAPHEKAPSFVKGSIVISMNDFIAWAKENTQHLTDYKGVKQLRLQITEWEGKFNIQVDTFKPSAPRGNSSTSNSNNYSSNSKDNSDLPF